MFGSWLLCRAFTDRTIVNLFNIAACLGGPLSAEIARKSSRSGTVNPAIPARLAFKKLRRLRSNRPSDSRALKSPKACWPCPSWWLVNMGSFDTLSWEMGQRQGQIDILHLPLELAGSDVTR